MKKLTSVLFTLVLMSSTAAFAKTRETAGKRLCFNSVYKCQSALAKATKLTDLNRKIRVSGQCKKAVESGCKVSLETNFNLKYIFTADQKAHNAWEVQWSGGGLSNPYFNYVGTEVNRSSKHEGLRNCREMLSTLKSLNTRKLSISGYCSFENGQYIQDHFYPPHVSGEFEVKILK